MKMASSKTLSSTALFLSLNLIFFSMVSSATTLPPPTCPINALQLGVCANLLDLVNVQVGSPPTIPCCSLIQGLTDLEVAVCLCTALRANILGINLNIDLSLSLLLNACGKRWPSGFTCP